MAHKLLKNIMKQIIFTLVLFYSISIVSQTKNPSTITFKNGSTKTYKKLKPQYNAKDYITGVEAKAEDNSKVTYNNTQISGFKNNGTNYISKQYKTDTYFLEEVILGSLSVYKSGTHYFLESEENGLREILKVVINEKQLNTFDYATISVYVNKCKEAQEQAYNKSQIITYGVLKSLVTTYNACNLSESTQFASTVIKEANSPSEVIEIGINVGYNFLNTSFDNIVPGVSNSYGTPVIGAQVYFNTNMLKNNIVFLILVDYSIPNMFKSRINSTYLDANMKFLTTMIGARYTFNNINKTFSPYLGANGGFIFNSKSRIVIQENIIDSPLNNYESTNQLAYNLGIGTYIHFGKQKVDFNFTYLPESKFDLILTGSQDNKERYYTMSSFQLKATYIF